MPNSCLLHYPGSKAKLTGRILACVPPELQTALYYGPWDCYCEPFFGAGGFGMGIFPIIHGQVQRVIANDIDPAIHALWYAVYHAPKPLIEKVQSFTPTVDAFYRFKEMDSASDAPDWDPVELGFRKLALHQMSFSGYGSKCRGPRGGRAQGGVYKVGSHWDANRHRKTIIRCYKTMRQFSHFDIRNDDFAVVLASLPPRSFVYLDPPYFEMGNSLYRYGMTKDDHRRLAGILRTARYSWVLSYDDAPDVRQLYSWAHIRDFEMTPSNQLARRISGIIPQVRRKKRELVICGGQETKWGRRACDDQHHHRDDRHDGRDDRRDDKLLDGLVGSSK